MSSRPYNLRRNFGSSTNRSAGVFDSTYGVQDEATRLSVTASSQALRQAMLRVYVQDASARGGDIYDAMARAGMQP